MLHRPVLSVALVSAALAVSSAAAGPSGVELASVTRTGGRLQAVATLSGGGANTIGCLTPYAQMLRMDPAGSSVPARRALALLGAEVALPGERRISERDLVVRYTIDRGALDRLDPADDNGNGRPDLVEAAILGASRAQRLLVGQLDLPAPAAVEIVLARLGSGIDGVLVPGRDGRVSLWIDPAARPAGVRRAAEHQYAHAVAGALGLDAAWSEALATWVSSEIEGAPDDRALVSLARRMATLSSGLPSDDLDLASGNAAWLAYLAQAHGTTAVKLAAEELAKGGAEELAFDRALRRGAGTTFDSALRDFHLWSTFTGPRDDHRHLSFASRLPAPAFAAVVEALPALSVQADPEVAPLGAATIALRPQERTGGLALRFEGDPTARWSVDVVLVRASGAMHRVPVALDDEDAGEITVPLQDVREALLLVRNLDGEGRAPRRYTWSAHAEPGYPAEIATVAVERAGRRGGAVVTWETTRELGVLGFNVLRSRPGELETTRVNPVWVPALGDAVVPAAYSFADPDARPGVAYEYRIETVTPDGLTSRSEPATIGAP